MQDLFILANMWYDLSLAPQKVIAFSDCSMAPHKTSQHNSHYKRYVPILWLEFLHILWSVSERNIGSCDGVYSVLYVENIGKNGEKKSKVPLCSPLFKHLGYHD